MYPLKVVLYPLLPTVMPLSRCFNAGLCDLYDQVLRSRNCRSQGKASAKSDGVVTYDEDDKSTL